jgi:hypothetical protein
MWRSPTVHPLPPHAVRPGADTVEADESTSNPQVFAYARFVEEQFTEVDRAEIDRDEFDFARADFGEACGAAPWAVEVAIDEQAAGYDRSRRR